MTHANLAISVPTTCLRLTCPGVTSVFPLPVPLRPSTLALYPQPQEAKAHHKGAWSPLASVSSMSQGTPALASDTCSTALPSTSSVGPELENEVPEVGEAASKPLGLEAQQQSSSLGSRILQALVQKDGGCGLSRRTLSQHTTALRHQTELKALLGDWPRLHPAWLEEEAGKNWRDPAWPAPSA